MIGLLLDGFILFILVFIVTSGTVEVDYWKMVGISLGVALVAGIGGSAVGGGAAAIVVLLLVLAALVFLLMAFCFCTLRQALIVAGLYFATHLGLGYLWAWLLA